jgi:hypothetical protein
MMEELKSSLGDKFHIPEPHQNSKYLNALENFIGLSLKIILLWFLNKASELVFVYLCKGFGHVGWEHTIGQEKEMKAHKRVKCSSSVSEAWFRARRTTFSF